MALTPWHLAQRLSCEEVAAILATHSLNGVNAGYTTYDHISDFHRRQMNDWIVVIKEAAQKGEIAPYHIKELVGYRDKDGNPVLAGSAECEGYDLSKPLWAGFDAEHDFWKRLPYDEFKLRFKRPEIYRWLKACGISDADIPEALRISPKPQVQDEQEGKPVHHRSRPTYLKLIEALALEAMGGEIPAEPYKAAGILQITLNKHGLKLDDETIAKVVADIHEAREARNSDPY